MIVMKKLSELKIRDGFNSRYKEGDLSPLSDSMGRHGLLQPIGINSRDEVVFGFGRLIAAGGLNWDEIACKVLEDEFVDEPAKQEASEWFTSLQEKLARDALEQWEQDRAYFEGKGRYPTLNSTICPQTRAKWGLSRYQASRIFRLDDPDAPRLVTAAKLPATQDDPKTTRSHAANESASPR